MFGKGVCTYMMPPTTRGPPSWPCSTPVEKVQAAFKSLTFLRLIWVRPPATGRRDCRPPASAGGHMPPWPSAATPHWRCRTDAPFETDVPFEMLSLKSPVLSRVDRQTEYSEHRYGTGAMCRRSWSAFSADPCNPPLFQTVNES